MTASAMALLLQCREGYQNGFHGNTYISRCAQLSVSAAADDAVKEGSKLSSSSFEFEFELARTFCR